MPLLLAWLPALITWLFNAWRLYVAGSFIWRVIRSIALLIIIYAVVLYVFRGFIASLVDWINTSANTIAPLIDAFSLFLPSNFETCVYIIISDYVLAMVLSWKERIATALGGV
ncbi:hypothetical protein OKT22_01385 [Providencia rettgeri]|uniref:hypothetical protein n=1 Tax=Providencia rettgeri TaxID=587 RepID=UPI002271CC46|nr:hypothetical protein [Providencia rettgeri]MCX9107688.1 hypothetical protein [Providencia rettgeri]HEM6859171.1 hypothetical protein [Providencia rettgeri]